MALTTQVTDRYSSQLLIEITNPDGTGASTIDTARLALAATDVEAMFRTHAGVEYDDSDARHVEVAVKGVILKLQTWLSRGAPPSGMKEFEEELGKLRDVTSWDRIDPKTNSYLNPSTRAADPYPRRPDLDSENFEDFKPDSPS